MDLDNIQRKYGLPAPLPVVQNGKFATRFPLNLEHRGDDVFQFGGKYIGEIENIYDLLYKILTNQEIDASLALPYAIKITEDKLYIRDKTNSEWITIFDITKPNFPKEIELYELIYKAITHQVISEDTSYPGQLKIEENILYVRDKDNLTWTQIGDVTKEFLGATEATQAILEQVNDILTEVQELKTELNRQIATTNETLTTALQAANEAMTSAQSINIRTFNSVEEMKASNTLKAGALAKTQGFYQSGDGGGADYLITDNIGQDEADEASIITLQNSLYAKLLVQDYINIKWFGARVDETTDDSEAFNKAVAFIQKDKRQIAGGYFKSKTLFIPSGTMKINNKVTLDVSCMSLDCDGTIINAQECKGTALYVDSTYQYYVPYMNQTHVFRGFTLLGKKSEDDTPNIGLEYSKGVGETSRLTWQNVLIDTFNEGIQPGENCYMNTYNMVTIKGCDKGYHPISDGITNSGERETFIACLFADNEVAIDSEHTTEMFFTNCSFDYNRQTLVLSKGRVHFLDCHVEYADFKKPHFVIKGSEGFLDWDGGTMGCVQYGGASEDNKYDDDTMPFYYENLTNTANNTVAFFKIRNVQFGLIPAKYLCNQEPIFLENNYLIGVLNLPVKVKTVQGTIYKIDNYVTPTNYLPTSLKNAGNLTITYANPNTFTVKKGTSGNNKLYRLVSAKNHKCFSFFIQGHLNSVLADSPIIRCEFGYLVKDKNDNLYKITSQGTVNVINAINSTSDGDGYTDKLWNKITYIDDNLNDVYAYACLDLTNLGDKTLTLKRFDLDGY